MSEWWVYIVWAHTTDQSKTIPYTYGGEERERYKMGEEDTNEEGERESERESGGRVIVFYVNIAMNH